MKYLPSRDENWRVISLQGVFLRYLILDSTFYVSSSKRSVPYQSESFTGSGSWRIQGCDNMLLWWFMETGSHDKRISNKFQHI